MFNRGLVSSIGGKLQSLQHGQTSAFIYIHGQNISFFEPTTKFVSIYQVQLLQQIIYCNYEPKIDIFSQTSFISWLETTIRIY